MSTVMNATIYKLDGNSLKSQVINNKQSAEHALVAGFMVGDTQQGVFEKITELNDALKKVYAACNVPFTAKNSVPVFATYNTNDKVFQLVQTRVKMHFSTGKWKDVVWLLVIKLSKEANTKWGDTLVAQINGVLERHFPAKESAEADKETEVTANPGLLSGVKNVLSKAKTAVLGNTKPPADKVPPADNRQAADSRTALMLTRSSAAREVLRSSTATFPVARDLLSNSVNDVLNKAAGQLPKQLPAVGLFTASFDTNRPGLRSARSILPRALPTSAPPAPTESSSDYDLMTKEELIKELIHAEEELKLHKIQFEALSNSCTGLEEQLAAAKVAEETARRDAEAATAKAEAAEGQVIMLRTRTAATEKLLRNANACHREVEASLEVCQRRLAEYETSAKGSAATQIWIKQLQQDLESTQRQLTNTTASERRLSCENENLRAQIAELKQAKQWAEQSSDNTSYEIIQHLQKDRQELIEHTTKLEIQLDNAQQDNVILQDTMQQLHKVDSSGIFDTASTSALNSVLAENEQLRCEVDSLRIEMQTKSSSAARHSACSHLNQLDEMLLKFDADPNSFQIKKPTQLDVMMEIMQTNCGTLCALQSMSNERKGMTLAQMQQLYYDYHPSMMKRHESTAISVWENAFLGAYLYGFVAPK